MQIIFLAPGENIPNGFELLRNTVSGKGSGYIAPCGYIAIQRASVRPDSKIVGDSLILDINAVKKSSLDEIPEKYVAIDREHGNANPYATNDIIFIVQPVTAIGICNVGYEASLLDRIPTKDYKHLSLPEDALPAFMFPHGLRLELCDRNQYPLPSFFTFVFTDQDGKHLYVACLKFYEEVAKDDLMAGFRQLWGEDEVRMRHLKGDSKWNESIHRGYFCRSGFYHSRGKGHFLPEAHLRAVTSSFLSVRFYEQFKSP